MQSKIHKPTVAAAFSAAANTYDQAAFIEQEIGHRLIARLTELSLQPQYILDLGCGTGFFTAQLQMMYPHATIIGIDFALGMLDFANLQRPGLYLGADAECLPFANLQFDLIFSNCCMPSISNLPGLFIELERVLSPNGKVLFTTFGPDTLYELGLDNAWPDMHIIGDLLLQQNYKDPVVDMEHLTFTYNELLALCEDLQLTGSFNIDTSLLQDLNSPCQTTFEVIYGIAGKSTAKKQFKDAAGNSYIAIEEITYL